MQAEIEDMGEMEQLLRERRNAAVTLHSPQRGEKRRLVEIAVKNAEDVLLKHQQSKQIKFRRTTMAMQELKDALSLPALPRRIEGYDISNTQGNLSVGSMVVFEQGMPNKKQYRHFRIKTVEGRQRFRFHGGGFSAAGSPTGWKNAKSVKKRVSRSMKAASLGSPI